MDHFLLTRLNMFRSEKQNDVEWLMYRLDLFETYCLPSVVRQKKLPTGWLLFISDGTPRAALDRLEAMISPYDFIACIPSNDFSADLAAKAVRSRCRHSSKWIITTRLDSDDAIHPRLLKSVYEAVSVGKYEYINPPSGLVVFEGSFYSKNDRSSAFVSASEPVENCKTAFIDQHIWLDKYAPMKQLKLKYAWMQIVHGGNIANRIRGFRVGSRSVKQQWEWVATPLAAKMRRENFIEIFLDNSIGLLTRFFSSASPWLRNQILRRDVGRS